MSVRVPGRYEKDTAKFQAALEQIAQGRMNCTGTFTLAANATSTTVAAATVAPGTIIVLSPQTADAAAVAATTFIAPSNVSQGSFIVTHASASSPDRTFGYIAIG
ncbi:MAG TPA: hypothetical protein VEU47_10900 [Candidatus Cybelea sp.]|nr:hypothetical protein [Candidatus Cybelea sp.]